MPLDHATYMQQEKEERTQRFVETTRREIILNEGSDEEVELCVEIFRKEVRLHRSQEHPWDNANGTGPDTSYDIWHMDVEGLKFFMKACQEAINIAEAYEEKRLQRETQPQD